MKKTFKDNLKKITALLLVGAITMSLSLSAFANESSMQDVIAQDKTSVEDSISDEKEAQSSEEFMEENTLIDEKEDKASNELEIVDALSYEKEYEISNELIEEDTLEEANVDGTEADTSDSEPVSDEEAREIECISGYNGKTNPDYLKKFLTYLSLKYPEIGINPKYGDGANTDDSISDDNELKNWYNAAKMGRQRKYETIEINGNDTFEGYPNLTKNMVQFRYLGNFDGSIGGTSGNNDTVKTLIIRNVDEIRNLYVPEFVETLIIENTTINCYESPGFQSDSYGDLKNCRNLKKLVFKNVKFGDNYKNPDREVGTWGKYGYEMNYRLNLQNCYNLEELEISVSFEGAQEIQLAIDGGTDNLFEKLSDEKCKINPAPGTGYEQVNLYANANSYLAKRYNSSEGVKFENGQFRLWLLDAIGVDSNNDGVISQAELDAIKTLTINNQTAHSAKQTSLSAFYELADISKMHGLKSLEIDFYDPDYSNNANRHPLKGIDFPDYLENLTIKNVYWEKDTQTKSHDNADIVLTNLKTLELYNTDVKVSEGASYFNHPTQIKLTDTEGVLQSCIIEKTDVESIELINNSTGKGIKNQDEKQRIRFSASECQNLQSIEFLGEGYAVEGSLDLTNDTALKHIGIPNAGKTQWTVYGEFDSTYAPINVILNSCSSLGSDCSEIVIDYDFINGRDINVQTMNTSFNAVNMLTIKRIPRIPSDTAGKVYLSCDTGSWVYSHYENEPGFVIENRSSFPTIAVFADGQRIRTNGEGNHNNDSEYTEDTDHFVERWDLVMPPYGYSNNFGNLTFYVVDKAVDGAGNRSESLRKVFYGSTGNSVYVEWEQQEHADSIITLPTVKDETGGYKLTGTKLSSTGTPGEVQLKLYVYNDENDKSYIGYQNIKIFKMPDSVELVNDGTKRGSGTKDDPFILDKESNEELKLKARLLVKNGDDVEVDRSGDYALRDVYWRIKEYDETPKYTSDSDGYSLYTLDSATKAGISVVRGELNPGETEAQYDRRVDNGSEEGQEPTYYNHRRFTFDNAGSKFKIVAQSPYKNSDGEVISSEVYVKISDKPISIDVSNDNKFIHGKNGWDESTITITDIDDVDIVDVNIKNQDKRVKKQDEDLGAYKDYFTVDRDSSSTGSKEVWKLKINSSDNLKIKNFIDNLDTKIITLVIKADDEKTEKVINLSSVFEIPDTKEFWCEEIEDQTYTGKAIKPKLNIYNGGLCLVEGKDYTLAYGNNVNVASKTAVNTKGKNIGPYVTITGKGNYSDKKTFYFSIVPHSIKSTAKVDDIVIAKTGRDIKITPIVTLDGKKLRQGTDYVVSTTKAEEDAIASLKEPQDYQLYVVGKGNYTGAVQFSFTITESILASKVAIQKIADQIYNDGAEVKPAIKIIYNKKDVTDCFDVKYENNIEIGTATVVVTSKKTSEGRDYIGEAGYSFNGSKKATFKINGLKISDTKLGIDGKGKMPVFIYSGKKHKPSINLYYKTGVEPLEEGKDYTITYSNNINAGNATALVTGKGKYTGTKKFTYKINKYDAGNDADGVIAINNGADISVSYEKGGVVPKPTVSMNGVVLTEKKDYTIGYANNNAVVSKDAVNSSGKSIAPTIIVTFKGNFSGKSSVAFTITAKDISTSKIILVDKPASTSKNAWKQTTATILDTNGKKLAAGTDFNKTFEYYREPECNNAITDEIIADNTLTDNTVYVRVTGIKNYEGSYIVGSYRISKTNISTVSATISDRIYTGTSICPSAEEIEVWVGSKNNKIPLEARKDYEIVAGSYTNNINKGTASVTIRGIGDYYGTKVVKYKICVNKIRWWN